MKKTAILIGLFLSICWELFAQRPINIDSLRKELDKLDRQKSSFSRDTNKVKILFEISTYHRLNTDSGFYYKNLTLELAQRIKWQKGVALAYLEYYDGNNIPKWSENVQKAFAIALKINDVSLQADCYGQFAAIYATQSNYPLAIKYFSLTYELTLKSKDYFGATNALNNVAQCWLQQGNKPKALTFFKKSLALAKHHNQKLVEAMSLSNIGSILKDSAGFEKQAIEYTEYSNKLFRMLKRPLFLADGLATIGETYLKKKEYKKALPYILEASNTYKKYNWAAKTEVEDNFDASLYGIYKGLNQPSKALFHLEKYNTLLDSLLKSEVKTQQDIVKMQEEKIKMQEEKIKIAYQNQLKQYTLWAGLGMVLLIALILYGNNLREKKAKNLLREQKEKVESTLSQLKSTQAQLIQSEKLASLGELTAGIAHEIQNPLNFVNNFSELSVDLVKELKEEIEKPKQDKEYIGELFDDLAQNQEKINHHGKRASSILKGMLEHSRTSTGDRALTDINKLADEYLRLSYLGIRAKDNNFNSDYQTDFDENLPKIAVIPQDIGRVLLNLVNNAFWAVNERSKNGEAGYEPKVIISTELKANSQLLIAIKDNGTGMSKATKAKIFQPFFTTKPTGQGTGLGLSLAYDIVTKGHGGTIECESVEGVGTEFIIQLSIV